jgi:hypothetical protein
MTAAVDAVVATAADIICSLRAADLAGWTPPWRKPGPSAGRDGDAREQAVVWPAVARGKRTRSRRGSSPSASAGSGSTATGAKKKQARRAERGSPPSPLDYSAGSGASTSGAEDGAFCSPPPPPVVSSASVLHVEPVNRKVRVLPFLALDSISRPVSCWLWAVRCFPLLRVRAWRTGPNCPAASPPRG